MKTAIDDPTFAAIENHRQAEAAWVAVCDDEHNGLCDVSIARLTELLTMTPTSVAGCAAMLRHVAKYADSYDGNLLENYCAEVKEPAGTLLIRDSCTAANDVASRSPRRRAAGSIAGPFHLLRFDH